jgi:alkylhydroperoxidase/carboxymuconolactone decarboxylase family protein YurZ
MRTPDDPEANQPVFDVDPEFGKMAVQMGQGFKLPGVSLREKSLLCLANDVCEMNLDLAFQMHVSLALANGVSGQEIREVLYHLAPETGYAKVLQAIVRLNEIEKSGEPETAQRKGRAHGSHQSVSIPTELRARVKKIEPRFETLLRQQVEERWNRPGLTPKERAYISLAADVSGQTLGAPFNFHCNAALCYGATPEQLRTLLLFMAEFSFSKTWQALEVFSEKVSTGQIVKATGRHPNA